jgi:hypothetical protein
LAVVWLLVVESRARRPVNKYNCFPRATFPFSLIDQIGRWGDIFGPVHTRDVNS